MEAFPTTTTVFFLLFFFPIIHMTRLVLFLLENVLLDQTLRSHSRFEKTLVASQKKECELYQIAKEGSSLPPFCSRSHLNVESQWMTGHAPLPWRHPRLIGQ